MRNNNSDIFNQLFYPDKSVNKPIQSATDIRFSVFEEKSSESAIDEFSYSSVVNLNNGRLTQRHTISLSSDTN